jgi:hypothetical protein
MAERTVIVCDTCGQPATERVTIRVGGRTLQKDLCAAHLSELLQGAHPARRGRQPSMVPPEQKRTSRAGAQASTPGARVAASGGRRRSARALRSANNKSADRKGTSSATGRQRLARKRISDPAILQKRRAALEKARKALAKKRAATAKAT